MRRLVVGLALLTSTGLFAQFRGTQPIVVCTAGSVVHPGSPAGLPGVVRTTPSVVNPGGGGVHVVVPGQHYRRNPTYFNGRGAVLYGYPVYIGGYYDTPYISEQPEMSAPVQPNIVVVYPQQPAPVIVNQGYPSAPANPGTAESQTVYPESADQAPAPAESSHYLIAFKDHTIYAATAYWVDGDTLHYFTSGNTHNQVSLALVDRELTERLNQEAGISVKLPAPAK